MIRKTCFHATVLAVAALMASAALAGDGGPIHVMKGNVLKYSQPIGHLVQPDNMDLWGEDIPSDVDWRRVMEPSTQPLPPNWVIADDFRDPFDTPVLTVRWWGSYVGPTFQHVPGAEPVPIFGPRSEDGYVISFFKDIPAVFDPATGETIFSRPGELLGSYVLPLEKVWIEETPHIGWHNPGQNPDDPRLRIYEYKANLMDAHLDHPSDLADSMGFHQRPGEVYWISIMAEVGHKIERITNAAGEDWVSVPTDKFAMPNPNDPENPEGHFWGWHTSPERFNDVATMGHLAMPGNQWEYFGWQPIQPRHHLFDMAFELYTVPEPASALLMGMALIIACGYRRRIV